MIILNEILEGDSLAILKTLESGSVHCAVTSPPYWNLRDYGVPGQLGLEKTPEEFVANMVALFREVRRVLRNDGTLWLNIGDSYSADRKGGSQGKNGQRADRRFTTSTQAKTGTGLKNKDLVGIPWMLAFALRADGWYLRQDIIWHKPNPMPESVRDRCTKAHEYVFLLSKSSNYYFDNDAIREPLSASSIERGKYGWGGKTGDALKMGATPGGSSFKRLKEKGGTISELYNPLGRNKRSVWSVTTKPYKGAHFATFPETLIAPMILAGCPRGGVVLDPFMGAGTTAVVAKKFGREYIGIELNPEYIHIAEKRVRNSQIPLLI